MGIDEDMNMGADMNEKKLRDKFRGFVSAGEGYFSNYSVLVPVVSGKDGLSLLYEVRAHHMERQPGEVCFPGGLIEEGESPLLCALRETREEIGLSDVDVICSLGPVYLPGASVMHAVLGIVREDALSHLELSPSEVSEVFRVSLSELLSAEPDIYMNEVRIIPDPAFPCREVTGKDTYPWRVGKVPVPVYDVLCKDGKKRVIWGLTARITKQVCDVIRP